MQSDRHHIPDDEGTGAVALDLRPVQRQFVQRAAPHLLLRPRRVDDDGRRCPARPPAIDQLATDAVTVDAGGAGTIVIGEVVTIGLAATDVERPELVEKTHVSR